VKLRAYITGSTITVSKETHSSKNKGRTSSVAQKITQIEIPCCYDNGKSSEEQRKSEATDKEIFFWNNIFIHEEVSGKISSPHLLMRVPFHLYVKEAVKIYSDATDK
jgi:hypothetical protein